MDGGIYLIVHFNWPKPFQPEHGEKARALHLALEGEDWIDEVFAASGGLGKGLSSIWVFHLENYGALDRLFGGGEPVSEAYIDFFSSMEDIDDMIREAVAWKT